MCCFVMVGILGATHKQSVGVRECEEARPLCDRCGRVEVARCAGRKEGCASRRMVKTCVGSSRKVSAVVFAVKSGENRSWRWQAIEVGKAVVGGCLEEERAAGGGRASKEKRLGMTRRAGATEASVEGISRL